MTESFRALPLLLRICVAVGLAFALTQAEAAYDRHRDYAPVARAEQAASASGQPVTSLPYDEVEQLLSGRAGESQVRARWREGNRAFQEAYAAVTARTGREVELQGDRCYVFPVTGEVRTRLRGTVALAAFCFEGDPPASAPVLAALQDVAHA